MQFLITDDNKTLMKATDFDPVKSFLCGQCFRWHRQEDGSYTGVVSGKVLNVRTEDNAIVLKGTSEAEFQDFWSQYFDLHTDYNKIQERLLRTAPWIKPAVISGNGIHIFHQDLWEIYISFIISSNNNISRISGIIETISRHLGDQISTSLPGQWFQFPEPEALAMLSEADWRKLNVGYRAPFLADAVKSWTRCQQEISKVSSCTLQSVSGIGPKVASCIRLFGTEQRNIFPIDVWVRRAMMHFYYQNNRRISDAAIQEDALKLFGHDAGFAQQYLFHHARSHSIS